MTVDLESARRALRAAAQKYAHTSKDSAGYSAAVEEHERAALVFALVAAQAGMTQR